MYMYLFCDEENGSYFWFHDSRANKENVDVLK